MRVLELSGGVATSYTGRLLADEGAEVIKVEAPQGDDTRQWGPPFVERENDKAASYFHSCNRGKSSLVIDFRTDEGQTKLRELISDVDILIENFKVGGLKKYGLDWNWTKREYLSLLDKSGGKDRISRYAKKNKEIVNSTYSVSYTHLTLPTKRIV